MKYNKLTIFKTFSEIPLDIEGSNIALTQFWRPQESDKETMGEKIYNEAIQEFDDMNAKALFTNLHLKWDYCDCGGGYGCSHGSWVYEIRTADGFVVDIEEDTIYINNIMLPIEKATVYDFYRMCEMENIKLEFSETAIKLLNENKC